MLQRRSYAYLMLIVIVVVAPTAASLGWYQMSKDPHLRPLGITQQAIRAYENGGEGLEIVALVDLANENVGGPSHEALAATLRRSFSAKGMDVRIVFRDSGGGLRITYLVGRSVVGPFPASRASEGIAAAVAAFRMDAPADG